MPKITAYYAPWCGNCHVVLPKVKAYAHRKGYKFEKIDVEKCSTETCESVSYVPHILVDGRVVSDRQLEQMIKDV